VTRRVLCGTHTRLTRCRASGQPVEVRDFAVWRCKDGKGVEIPTTQNRLSSLNQISHLPEEVYAAWRMIASGRLRELWRRSDLPKEAAVPRCSALIPCRHVRSAAATAVPMRRGHGVKEPGRRPWAGIVLNVRLSKIRSDKTACQILRNRVRSCCGSAYRAGAEGLSSPGYRGNTTPVKRWSVSGMTAKMVAS
jgi:hypothetical protein